MRYKMILTVLLSRYRTIKFMHRELMILPLSLRTKWGLQHVIINKLYCFIAKRFLTNSVLTHIQNDM